jgi:hypothetical protein
VISFSVTDAAFTGFRVVREHYRALLYWSPLAFVISLALSATFIAMGGRVLDIQALQADPAQAPTLMVQMAPALLTTAAVAFVANAIVYAAMNRAVLRPADAAFGFLRVGQDEARQLGLILILGLLFVGIYLGLVIVASLLAVVAALGGKTLGLAVAAAMVVTTLCLILILAIRLSLASALAFETKKISLREAWRLTAGGFWPILGTYLLAGALTAVVLILAWLVEMGLGAAVTGGDLRAFAASQPDTLAGLVTGLNLLHAALDAVISALIWPLILTPAAAIYSRVRPSSSAAL